MGSQPYAQGGDPVDPARGGSDPRGFGYVLAIVGLAIALAGFAVAAYAIIALASGARAGDASVNPFTQPIWRGVPIPALAAGFGLFYLGGVLLTVGAGVFTAEWTEAEGFRRH